MISFWNMMLRHGVVGYSRFGREVDLENSSKSYLPFKMKATLFETSVLDDPVTQRRIPDEGNSHLHLKRRKARIIERSVTMFEIGVMCRDLRRRLISC